MKNRIEIESIVNKCIKCGFCESVCPTLPAADYNSIMGARGRILLAQFAINNEDQSLKISDSFYSCLDCFACVQVCPAGINAGQVSELMKEGIADEKIARVNPVAEMIKNVVVKYKNPLGIPEECSKWAENIEFSVSETLLLTGDMYQLMPYTRYINKLRKHTNQTLFMAFSWLIGKMPFLIKLSRHFYDKKLKLEMESSLRNIVSMLQRSEVKFNYLREDEPYPGTFLYDLGYMNEFKEYAGNLYRYLKSKNVKRIICVDPHTYDVLKNKYPDVIENFDLDIVYYTDLLNLNFKKSGEKITVQEPCHMVLHGNTYRAMDILNTVADVKLPANSGKSTMCCGGPDELLFPEISENVSIERYRNLKNSSNKIVTICPLCYNSLSYDDNVQDFSNFMKNLM